MSQITVRENDTKEALKLLAQLPEGDVLLPYQQRANTMVSQHALLVIEKSRRVGLTWGLAAEAVLTAGASRAADGTNVYYISYNTDMTRDFIDACGMWAKAFGIAASAVKEELLEDGDDRKAIKALSITFASGFRIQALSSAPRSLRGKQGLIIIDEAAFVDKLSELLKAAIAMLIWGGRVVVVSTHNGKDNPFNQLIEEIRAGQRKGAVLRITFDEAIAQGLWERIKLVKPKTTPPKEEWIALVRETYGANADEELDVIPAAGSGSYLNPADIAACVHPDAGKPELYTGGLCYHGRDIARRKDLNVDVTLEDVRGMLWTRELTTMQNATFREQDDEFARRMKVYRIIRAGLDQTGMGEVIVEQAQEKYGSHRVEGYLFTNSVKLALAGSLRRRTEERTLLLPDDPLLSADLRSIKRTAGTGETVRLVEDGTSDAHADRFWAYALASFVADIPYQSYDYISANSRAGRKALRDYPGLDRGISGSKGLLA
jgi:phage FluMu gp28-like protein